VNSWKITLPVVRAEEREDGGLYLVGEASGPEPDSHGTAMSEDAIADFARQIADRLDAGDPIPYLDSHIKVGLLRQLGHIVEGSITPDFHLRVVVRLDESNPAARYLHESITGPQKKQYGMSVGGDGVEFRVQRNGLGEKIIQFTKVLLREISNTTKPSWVPSFGTVLARSLDGDISQENDMAEDLEKAVEETTPDAEPVTAEVALSADAVQDVTSTEESVEEEAVVERADEAADTEPVEEPVVERARIAKKDSEALLASYKALGDQLISLGVLEGTEESTPAPAPENTTVENSDTGEEDLVEVGGVRLERSIAESITTFVSAEVERVTTELMQTVATQQEYITQLESMPAGKVPAPLVREKFESDKPDLSKMTPEERLRWGLNGIYANR